MLILCYITFTALSYVLITLNGDKEVSLILLFKWEVFIPPSSFGHKTFVFGLVCKVVVEIQKEFYSFHMQGLTTWIDHLEIKFCFGLVCKVVVEVQRSFLLFTYINAPHVRKTRVSFLLFNFIDLFHELIAFLSCHFVLLCFLILVHCAMERQESCMFSAKRLLSFAWRSTKCKGCALKLINMNHTIGILCTHYHKIVIYTQIILN
jgi:hypothetical protein